jgi:hypothetical protein
MTNERVGRRELLMGAGAGAVALAAIAVPASSAAASAKPGHRGGREDRGNQLEGGWLITRQDTGASSTTSSVVTIAPGGAVATIDINPPASCQLGAWVATGEHKFAATIWGSSTDPSGNVFIVKIDITGRWHHDHISGSYTFTVTTGSGGPVSSGTGTFEGSRIQPGA